MTTATPRTPRKVKKTTAEVVPEVKLQEPRHHKKYDRNSGKLGLNAGVRVALVVAMILGSFFLGVRMGLGEFAASLKEKPSQTSIDPMVEHCMLMPNMPGCEAYVAGASGGTNHDMMDMTMRDMGKMLEGKFGDDLDKAFLEAMIPHHEGAVEMAKTLTNSNHIELRQMGEAIIKSQTAEIEQMKKWQVEWGFKPTPTPADKIAL